MKQKLIFLILFIPIYLLTSYKRSKCQAKVLYYETILKVTPFDYNNFIMTKKYTKWQIYSMLLWKYKQKLKICNAKYLMEKILIIMK